MSESDAAAFKEHAEQCRQMALRTTSEFSRRTLEELARAWDEIAERYEENRLNGAVRLSS